MSSVSMLHGSTLDSFINKNYDCKGNVTDIRQAKVVLLGEDHSIDRHIQMI